MVRFKADDFVVCSSRNRNAKGFLAVRIQRIEFYFQIPLKDLQRVIEALFCQDLGPWASQMRHWDR